MQVFTPGGKCRHLLRLDNTGAGGIDVDPLLLCNHMTDNVDLYIK